MDAPRKDNNSPPVSTNDISAARPGVSSTIPSGTYAERSWGDKYKVKTLHIIRDDLVNYIINFIGSAIFAYKVERSPLQKRFDKAINWSGEQGEKIGIPAIVGRHIGSFFTKTQLLLCGGHAILPFMKYTHDNKKALEFSIGHRLDQFQEFMGHGNAASRRRLKEYKVIKDIFKSKPHELSEDEKALLVKNCIGDNLQFNEHRSTWGHVIKARLGGVAFTTALSIGLGFSNAQKTGPFKVLNFNDQLQAPAGKKIAKHLLDPLPMKIADSQHMGENLFTETIYTLASKLGFDRIEKRQFRKEREAERAAATLALKKDEAALTQTVDSDNNPADNRNYAASIAARPSALDARQKILSEGEKDFRARETVKPEQAIALS